MINVVSMVILTTLSNEDTEELVDWVAIVLLIVVIAVAVAAIRERMRVNSDFVQRFKNR